MSNEENIGISFVNIPIEIFSSKELTANEKILYGYLSIFKKQCCFQSNEKLAETLGVSVPTITNALKHLSDLEYIFIELVNNNNAKRRIYVIFDNPKKLKYLVSKGFLGSFPHSNKNYESSSESNKNYEMSNKNYESHNRGESNKNYEHKIINNNKNIGSQDSAIKEPSQASNKYKPLVTNKNGDMSQEEYEKAFYARNTVTI